MTRVLALADQSKIGCITQRRFAKVGTKTHPQRGADLDRNGLSVSTETACRFEPKSPVGNSEICNLAPASSTEATVDPPPGGPDWMPITPKTGSLFHADSQVAPSTARDQPQGARVGLRDQ